MKARAPAAIERTAALSPVKRRPNNPDVEVSVTNTQELAPLVMVPREPTREMVHAAFDTLPRHLRYLGYPLLIGIYKAMLSAAPPPPIPEEVRLCTCHPDDNPPRPCPQKYALTECRAAHQSAHTGDSSGSGRAGNEAGASGDAQEGVGK